MNSQKRKTNIQKTKASKKKSDIYNNAKESDYVDATHDLDDAILAKIGDGYLDKLGKEVSSNCKVETRKLDFDNIGSYVWKIYPAFSTSFLNKIVNEFNKLKFMHDPNNRHGKRLIRFASMSEEKRYFMIGRCNTMIESLPCSGIETELLDIANQVMEIQNKMISKALGPKVHVKKWIGTEILSSFGLKYTSGYEKHNDASVLLCADDESDVRDKVTS